MRQIVRYCAGCHQEGIRTELAETEPDVTIVIGRYGAHTDLCANCQDRLLGPVLAVMATGEGLDDLALADWAKLGQQKPPTRATRRRAVNTATRAATDNNAPANADVDTDSPAIAAVFQCETCGKIFDNPGSLGGHKKFYGKRPHEASTSKPNTRPNGQTGEHNDTVVPAARAEDSSRAESISHSPTLSQ